MDQDEILIRLKPGDPNEYKRKIKSHGGFWCVHKRCWILNSKVAKNIGLSHRVYHASSIRKNTADTKKP